MILTFDFQCVECGIPLRIPIQPEWDNPVYVMEMEREVEFLKDELSYLKREMMELAEECVDAGVKPSIMQRADEMREKFEELKRRFGVGEGENQ